MSNPPIALPEPLATVPPPAAVALAWQTRLEHDALLQGMHALEAALAAAAPGREAHWCQRVAAMLLRFRHALVRHVTSAEDADGLLAGVDDTRPTLLRQVEWLRREHRDLLAQTNAVLALAKGSSMPGRFRDIREHALGLLGVLRHHQAQEADLIFESFYTDIGTGD